MKDAPQRSKLIVEHPYAKVQPSTSNNPYAKAYGPTSNTEARTARSNKFAALKEGTMSNQMDKPETVETSEQAVDLKSSQRKKPDSPRKEYDQSSTTRKSRSRERQEPATGEGDSFVKGTPDNASALLRRGQIMNGMAGILRRELQNEPEGNDIVDLFRRVISRVLPECMKVPENQNEANDTAAKRLVAQLEDTARYLEDVVSQHAVTHDQLYASRNLHKKAVGQINDLRHKLEDAEARDESEQEREKVNDLERQLLRMQSTFAEQDLRAQTAERVNEDQARRVSRMETRIAALLEGEQHARDLISELQEEKVEATFTAAKLAEVVAKATAARDAAEEKLSRAEACTTQSHVSRISGGPVYHMGDVVGGKNAVITGENQKTSGSPSVVTFASGAKAFGVKQMSYTGITGCGTCSASDHTTEQCTANHGRRLRLEIKAADDKAKADDNDNANHQWGSNRVSGGYHSEVVDAETHRGSETHERGDRNKSPFVPRLHQKQMDPATFYPNSMEINVWLRQYEVACKVNNWLTDENKVMAIMKYLAADPQIVMNQYLKTIGDGPVSFADVKKLLSNEYTKFREEEKIDAERKLAQRRLQENEKPTALFRDIEMLSRIVDPVISPTNLIKNLVVALRSDQGIQKKMSTTTFDTWDDAKTEATHQIMKRRRELTFNLGIKNQELEVHTVAGISGISKNQQKRQSKSYKQSSYDNDEAVYAAEMDNQNQRDASRSGYSPNRGQSQRDGQTQRDGQSHRDGSRDGYRDNRDQNRDGNRNGDRDRSPGGNRGFNRDGNRDGSRNYQGNGRSESRNPSRERTSGSPGGPGKGGTQCFVCDSKTHWAKDCPFKSTAVALKICEFCEKDHESLECPDRYCTHCEGLSLPFKGHSRWECRKYANSPSSSDKDRFLKDQIRTRIDNPVKPAVAAASNRLSDQPVRLSAGGLPQSGQLDRQVSDYGPTKQEQFNPARSYPLQLSGSDSTRRESKN